MANVLEFFVKMKDMMSTGLAKIATNADRTFTAVENKVFKTISANKKLADSLDSVKGKVNEVDQAANKSSFFNGSMLKKLAIGATIAAGLTAGAAFAKDSVSKAMDFGATKMSFQVLTGDKGKGEGLANELNKLQQDTILGPSVFKNAQTMMGFGIAAERVVPTLKMLGDVSMGDENKLSALTLAFSQVSAAGKLSGQDLLQMINAGYNPLNDISKMTGKSIGQLKKEMEKGAISSDLVTKAFEKATGKGGLYNNMLNTLADTPFGKMQQLSGQFESFQVKLGEAMMPLAVQGMGFLDTMLQLANMAIPYIITGVQMIQEGIAAVLNPTGQWAFWMEWIKYMLGLVWSGVSYVAAIIWGIVKSIFQWASNSEIIKDVFSIIADVASIVWGIIKKVADVLAWLFNNVIMPVLNAIEAAYRWVKNVLGLGGKEIKVVGEVNGNIKNTSVTLADAGKLPGESKVTPTNIAAPKAGAAMQSQKDETAKGITGGGPRVVNISIGKMVEKLEINASNINEGLDNMEGRVHEILLRVLNSGASVQ